MNRTCLVRKRASKWRPSLLIWATCYLYCLAGRRGRGSRARLARAGAGGRGDGISNNGGRHTPGRAARAPHGPLARHVVRVQGLCAQRRGRLRYLACHVRPPALLAAPVRLGGAVRPATHSGSSPLRLSIRQRATVPPCQRATMLPCYHATMSTCHHPTPRATPCVDPLQCATLNTVLLTCCPLRFTQDTHADPRAVRAAAQRLRDVIRGRCRPARAIHADEARPALVGRAFREGEGQGTVRPREGG